MSPVQVWRRHLSRVSRCCQIPQAMIMAARGPSVEGHLPGVGYGRLHGGPPLVESCFKSRVDPIRMSATVRSIGLDSRRLQTFRTRTGSFGVFSVAKFVHHKRCMALDVMWKTLAVAACGNPTCHWQRLRSWLASMLANKSPKFANRAEPGHGSLDCVSVPVAGSRPGLPVLDTVAAVHSSQA